MICFYPKMIGTPPVLLIAMSHLLNPSYMPNLVVISTVMFFQISITVHQNNIQHISTNQFLFYLPYIWFKKKKFLQSPSWSLCPMLSPTANSESPLWLIHRPFPFPPYSFGAPTAFCIDWEWVLSSLALTHFISPAKLIALWFHFDYILSYSEPNYSILPTRSYPNATLYP